MNENVLMDEKGAAEYLGCSANSLRAWRCRRGGVDSPRFVRVGRLVKYRRVDLDAWLNARAGGGGPVGDAGDGGGR